MPGKWIKPYPLVVMLVVERPTTHFVLNCRIHHSAPVATKGPSAGSSTVH